MIHLTKGNTMNLEELQSFIGKEVLVSFKGSESTVTGEIKAANVAGVPFKEKGKAGVDLRVPEDFVTVELAPVKEKTISQSKLKPVPEGQVRKHLATYHGVSLKWCREATEAEAKEYHDSLDHSDSGHKHVEPKDDERSEALSGDEAGNQAEASVEA